MANVGSGSSGQTLIGAGNGASPTYAAIGTNCGLSTHGVILAQGNSPFIVASPSTSGGVLTSNGATSNPTFQALPASSITINGDSGSVSGGTLTFQGSAGGHAGQTVKFVGSGTTMDLNLSDANDTITIGRAAGNSSQTGVQNIGVGVGTFAGLTNGANNVAIGYISMLSLTSGQDNTAVGFSALQSNSTSSLNTGVGYSSLANTTGTQNTGVGSVSLQFVTSGSYNTALGFNSGSLYTSTESSNIAIGHSGVAADANTIRIGTQGTGNGQQNLCFIAGIVGNTVSNQEFVTINSATGQMGVTASAGSVTITGDSGSASGSSLTFQAAAGGKAGSTIKFAASGTTIDLNVVDGNDNLMLGRVAGNGTLSGSWNMGIGSGALNALTNGNFNTCLGYVSGVLIQGGSANTALGYFALDSLVSGVGNIALGYQTGIAYTSSESNNILIGNGGTTGESNVVRIGAQGSGAGQQNQCFIAGITGSTVVGTAVLCSSTGQLGTISSSKRYKENIENLPEEDCILNLRPVKFVYKSTKESAYGLIAEEVDKIMPQLVVYDAEGRPDSVKYHEFTALLLAEIQRLNLRISDLEENR